jgi:hypothetical protein
MDWYGYVITKGMIVQHIDAKEQQNIDEPTAKWDDVGR